MIKCFSNIILIHTTVHILYHLSFFWSLMLSVSKKTVLLSNLPSLSPPSTLNRSFIIFLTPLPCFYPPLRTRFIMSPLHLFISPSPPLLLSPSHFLLFTVLTVCRLLTFRLVFFVFISPPFFLPSPIPPPVFLQLLTWIGSPAVHALWSNQSVHSPFLHIKTWRPPFPLSICLHSFRFPQSLSVDPSSHLDSEFSAAFLFLSSLI